MPNDYFEKLGWYKNEFDINSPANPEDWYFRFIFDGVGRYDPRKTSNMTHNKWAFFDPRDHDLRELDQGKKTLEIFKKLGVPLAQV